MAIVDLYPFIARVGSQYHKIKIQLTSSTFRFLLSITLYLQPVENWKQWTPPRTDEEFSLHLLGAPHVVEGDLQVCFDIIEETSGEDYRASRDEWHPSKEIKKMKSPELRCIMVKNKFGQIFGFTSLMPTCEEGQPVAYCYEIHLKPELQGYAPSASVVELRDL
jgi:N-alpha-acetyltransferase 40